LPLPGPSMRILSRVEARATFPLAWEGPEEVAIPTWRLIVFGTASGLPEDSREDDGRDAGPRRYGLRVYVKALDVRSSRPRRSSRRPLSSD
jgi:hypothetical protein